MKKRSIRNAFTLLLSVLLMAAMILVQTGCGAKPADTETAAETQAVKYADSTTLGNGATTFGVVVVDDQEKTNLFMIRTDEETVGAALVALELISGDESKYGLYVKTVNGVTADYDKDQAYWAFYVNNEYSETGVDDTPVKAGATYTFKYTKG